MEKILKKYKAYIKDEKKLSENTIMSYENDIKKYFEYIKDKQMNIAVATENDVTGFLIHLQSLDMSPSTLSRIVSSIKSLYEFMCEKEGVNKNPAKKLKKPKIENGSIEILTQEEIGMILESIKLDSKIGKRDRALFEILYGTGMKVSEIISIDIDDVDIEMEYISCRCSGSSRAIPLGSLSLESIRNYMENARIGIVDSEGQQALFVNSKGERLTRQGIWKILKKYAKTAGIGKSVTPSVIRNSFAVHMIQNGADVKIVSQILGNSTLSCMQAYMDTVRKSARKEIKSKHPRG